MPAPPPESDPATISTRPFITKARRSFRRPHRGLGWRLDRLGAASDREDHLADLVDDARQQPLVLALRHDPDDRLGAGFADHQPPGIAEPRFALGDCPLHAPRLERLSLAEPHVAQELRHRLENTAHLAGMPAGL